MKINALFSRMQVNRRLISANPYLASFVVHAAALVVLSLILFPILPGSEFRTFFVSSELDSEELADEVETLPLEASLSSSELSADDARVRTDFSSTAESLAIDVESLASSESISLRYRDPALTPRDRSKKASDTAPLDESPQLDKRWGTAPREPSDTTEVRQADSPGGALSAITSAIQGELEQGDTLVVWLVDASISLQNDRELMAEHMESFYQSIGAFGVRDERQGPLLLNAVVAFGANAVEISPPNRMGIRVCGALKDMRIDGTGLENVMSAIQRALSEYRLGRRRRERMMIVIITDESGDDTLMLETTIQACRSCHVPVHIIGPSAVLGAERGSHAWVHPVTGNRYLLPVKRGPDTARAERLWLPYWHESLLPPWRHQGVQIAAGVQWYGGPYRERLISGFGPYALTRLSLETGGTFTVLDREADRGRFRLEDLRDYLPQYVSLREYEESVRNRPLRWAVSQVAALTGMKKTLRKLTPPRMVFMGTRHDRYPFAVRTLYVEPSAFARWLLPALATEGRMVAVKEEALLGLLSAFKSKKVDWEDEYAKEQSPRWRAWYDLTKGRLLALRVRCMEYRSACRELPSHLPLGINHTALHDAPNMVVPASRPLAEEATRLLERCVEKNPDTPWAHLAQWELDKGFGIGYTWSVVPRPRPVPMRRRVPWRVPNFPRM